MTKAEFLAWWPTIALALQVVGAFFFLLMVASLWRLFEKGGEPAWAALVPGLNLLVLLRLARKPWWWALLLLVPGINVFVAFVVCWSVAEVFGRGLVFAFGLTFLGFIYLPVLAFGEAEYVIP